MKNAMLRYPAVPVAGKVPIRPQMACLLILGLGLATMLPYQTALAAPGAESRLEILLRWAPLIISGFWLNLLMSFIAVIIGTLIGALLGIAQISPIHWLSRSAWIVTEFFRNAPTLVLLFLCMFLIPFEIQVGSWIIPFPAWVKAVLGLSLSKMAYVSEIVRGGLSSIPATQWEAADALSFTRWQTLRLVIIPQCIKRMLPPWMNAYAILIMSTPLASVLGVHEGLSLTRSAISAVGRPDMLTPFYLFLLALFFAYAYPISLWTMRLERRYTIKS
jgi:polar amino acid transport system permease protein